MHNIPINKIYCGFIQVFYLALIHSNHDMITRIKQVFKSTVKQPTQEVGSNQICILNNSKDLLEHPKAPNFKPKNVLKKTSSPLIFLPFLLPFLIGTLKLGVEPSYGTFQFTKMEIGDTHILFTVVNDHNL